MAVIARFLVDTSAAARMRLAAVADRPEPLITGGLVATCATLDAEALHSARSPAAYEHLRAHLRAPMGPPARKRLAGCPTGVQRLLSEG